MSRNDKNKLLNTEIVSKRVLLLNLQPCHCGNSVVARGLLSCPRVEYEIMFKTGDGTFFLMEAPIELFLALKPGMYGVLRVQNKRYSFSLDHIVFTKLKRKIPLL